MTTPLAIPSRKDALRRMREAGYCIAAVLPIYYPRALLRACGFHPIEVWGPARVDARGGDLRFQAYTCAIVRNAVSLLSEGKLDPADVLLVPHTCDALQGMGSVLGDFVKPHQRVLTLYHPRSGGPVAISFLVDELRRLQQELSAHGGREPTAADWDEALGVEADADAALAALYRDRGRLPLTDREFYTLVRAREYLPPDEFAALSSGVARSEQSQPHGIPLLLSGIVCEPMAVFDQINSVGGRIAADDLACGYRRLYPPVADGPPLERLARALLGTAPDPTRGSPIAERADALARRMRESGAKGLLVYDVKFCEPELFDLPRLRARLAEAGFPMLHVEHELTPAVSQQTLTRIEAFLETLQ
jgi:benzoyl-CoA reductase/2-hydroxyglutaryl-CoA dehydratase subunit BcrC/BadD/HgdB